MCRLERSQLLFKLVGTAALLYNVGCSILTVPVSLFVVLVLYDYVVYFQGVLVYVVFRGVLVTETRSPCFITVIQVSTEASDAPRKRDSIRSFAWTSLLS